MSFADDLARAMANAEAKTRDVFAGTVVALHGSITMGSPVTGAPGQPVDTTTLRNSWGYEFASPTHATISTPIEYAEAVEDGVGPHGTVRYGRKNNIGGSHSVKLTIASAQRIVDVEVARVTGLGT